MTNDVTLYSYLKCTNMKATDVCKELV